MLVKHKKAASLLCQVKMPSYTLRIEQQIMKKNHGVIVCYIKDHYGDNITFTEINGNVEWYLYYYSV